MNELIVKAINDRKLLTFHYKGKPRLIEPHTYGLRTDGREAVCAWQLDGGSGSDYRLFFVSEMLGMAIDHEAFAGPRDGYCKGDSRFSYIYAEL